MSAFQGTPGPWDGRQEYNDHRDEIIARGRVVAIVPVRETTGVLSDEKRIAPDPEGEANARLIQASPKLLAAAARQLANIERWMATGIPADAEESRSIYEQLREAVQAATTPPRPMTKAEEAAEVHKR